MPVEFVGQSERRILDMQDTTLPCACGPAGSVEQQRTHEQNVARGGSAKEVGLLAAYLLDATGRKPTQTMRTGKDAQSPIGLVGVVEVKPNAEHPLQEFDGWLNMRNAILHAPRAEAGNIDAVPKCQSQVLMPWNQPIRFGGFGEVNGANWKWFGRQVWADEIEKPARAR